MINKQSLILSIWVLNLVLINNFNPEVIELFIFVKLCQHIVINNFLSKFKVKVLMSIKLSLVSYNSYHKYLINCSLIKILFKLQDKIINRRIIGIFNKWKEQQCLILQCPQKNEEIYFILGTKAGI